MSYSEKEVIGMIKEIGTVNTELRGKVENRMDQYDKELEEIKKINSALETAAARQQFPGGGSSARGDGTIGGIPSTPVAGAPFAVSVGGVVIPMLARSESLAKFYPRASYEGAPFTLADYVRGAMGVKAAVTSGPALVPTYVGAQIIDLVRAASRVVQAGAGTINIDGPTNLAKITADATVYQHTEGTEDITESEPTIVPVKLDPKALVAAIPLSMEVVQDSPNLDAVLNMSIAAAFAGKLDALSLATILADTDIPDSATGQDCAEWAGVLAAVGAALALNQELPTAFIGNTADFIARASELASTAGSWMGKPPVLANMIELPTTGLDAGIAIFGDFLRGFCIAVRSELRLEVVRFAKYKSASHILVCHLRGDGVVLQPGRLFIQKTTVA